MQKSLRRILTGSIFFAITLLMAVIGYIGFGWTVLESVYMVVITIFGVGYGEVKPLETPAQKIFTIFVIIAGTSSAVYTVGGFVQMIAEGELNRVFDAQRKQRTLENLENHTIIAGFGYMGQILAQELHQNRQPFVIIDNNLERVNRAESLILTAKHDT
jgi:voltage-gated potassium channel